MPCSGPSKDCAYKIGEEAYADILVLLDEKYNVSTDDKTLAFYKQQHGFGYKHTTEAMANLKLAVQEMIWNDHAASF